LLNEPRVIEIFPLSTKAKTMVPSNSIARP